MGEWDVAIVAKSNFKQSKISVGVVQVQLLRNSLQLQLWHLFCQKEKINKKLNTKSLSVIFNIIYIYIHLLVEWSNTKSNIKLGRFWSHLQASYVSSHTEELRYNETVCLWMTVYIYIYIS